METLTREAPLFHEEQTFRQPWFRPLLYGLFAWEMGTFGLGMVEQLVFKRPWGNHPMSDAGMAVTGTLGLAFGVLGLAAVRSLRLITEVGPDAVRVQFIPLHRRPVRLDPDSIVTCEAVTYRPIPDYGGWGIRFGRDGKAYNVNGNRGVRLEFRGGGHLLIGSDRPEELAAAIGRIMGR